MLFSEILFSSLVFTDKCLQLIFCVCGCSSDYSFTRFENPSVINWFAIGHSLLGDAAAKSLQSCPTVRPHRWQPTRLPCPWDSPGKNTGVGCHFLLQCMKVKSEREVAQSCPTLATPWTAAYQTPPSMGFSRQKYCSGVPLPSPPECPPYSKTDPNWLCGYRCILKPHPPKASKAKTSEQETERCPHSTQDPLSQGKKIYRRGQFTLSFYNKLQWQNSLFHILGTALQLFAPSSLPWEQRSFEDLFNGKMIVPLCPCQGFPGPRLEGEETGLLFPGGRSLHTHRASCLHIQPLGTCTSQLGLHNKIDWVA